MPAASATITDGMLTLAVQQADEAFVLTVPAAGDKQGDHDLSSGTGYALTVSERSLDVSPELRGDYGPPGGDAGVYGTIRIDSIFLEPGGSIYGALDATLFARSGTTAATVHAVLQIHAPIAN